MSLAGSASTTGSARSSCTPVPAMAAAASRRTRSRCCKTAEKRASTSGSSARPSRSTTTARLQMVERVVARARRRGPGQARRRARAGVQAQHRRHARGAIDSDRQRRWSSAAPRSAPSIRSLASRPRRSLDGVEFADDAYAAAEGADALVIVTEWDEFRALDLDRDRGSAQRQGARRPAQRLRSRAKPKRPASLTMASAAGRLTDRPALAFRSISVRPYPNWINRL